MKKTLNQLTEEFERLATEVWPGVTVCTTRALVLDLVARIREVAPVREDRPVLGALLRLLQLKTLVTYQEIATLTGLPQQTVLERLLANQKLLEHDTKGRIKKVHEKLVPLDEIRNSGRIFRRKSVDYGVYVLGFCGNPEAEKLKEPLTVGGYGDSTTIQALRDTPENEAALRALGLVPEAEFDFDAWPTTIHWEE